MNHLYFIDVSSLIFSKLNSDEKLTWIYDKQDDNA